MGSVTHKSNESNSNQANRKNGKINEPKKGTKQVKSEARFGLRNLTTPVKSPGRFGQS